MTIMERARVAVFGLLLAWILGVLLAWVFLAMAVTVGTDDKGKTGASAEKIEILRVRPVPITIPYGLTSCWQAKMSISASAKRT